MLSASFCIDWIERAKLENIMTKGEAIRIVERYHDERTQVYGNDTIAVAIKRLLQEVKNNGRANS